MPGLPSRAEGSGPGGALRMTKRCIFLLREGEELRELVEKPFDAEVDLQDLLARYPNLLAGD